CSICKLDFLFLAADRAVCPLFSHYGKFSSETYFIGYNREDFMNTCSYTTPINESQSSQTNGKKAELDKNRILSEKKNYLRFKRFADIACSFIGLILLSPSMLFLIS
ncbi:MAG TPA: hypothetical protein DD413_00005, partial [Ruminococcus sp.]|nr:hypothetical protein [Ruminococcus sp.]